MDQRNLTINTKVQLIGFQIPQRATVFLFLLFLILYCLTVCGNLLIITLVSYSKSLHSPMYFFLSQLSVLDILLVTDISPNFMKSILVKENFMTITGCLTQFFFFVTTEVSECLLLTAMGWDRYLAICKPLHYNQKMNFRVCWILVIMSWCTSIFISFVYIVTLSKYKYCGSNLVDHFFCDIDPILKLSCSDTFAAQMEVIFVGSTFVIVPFIIVIVSYAYIISTIFKLPSTDRKKVFSTCSSHLIVVSIYYSTIVCVYLIPNNEQTWTLTKLTSLLYTVVTPIINPIIYSLRNKELKKNAVRLFRNLVDNFRSS